MSGKTPHRRTLGRGLDALLGAESETPGPDGASPPAGRAPLAIPIANIRPGKFQPRPAPIK